MLAAPRLVDSAGLEAGGVPVDITGAGMAGDYMSLKLFGHLTILLFQGAWAGGTPACTLKQATDVAGTGEKALAFLERWHKVALVDAAWTKVAVVANTFNLPAVANTMHALEIDADELDADNDFDCVRFDVASPGVNADLLSAAYILGRPRYSQESIPDAKVD